jgi:phosphoribosyl-AMP cyclohydrolase
MPDPPLMNRVLSSASIGFFKRSRASIWIKQSTSLDKQRVKMVGAF